MKHNEKSTPNQSTFSAQIMLGKVINKYEHAPKMKPKRCPKSIKTNQPKIMSKNDTKKTGASQGKAGEKLAKDWPGRTARGDTAGAPL